MSLFYISSPQIFPEISITGVVCVGQVTFPTCIQQYKLPPLHNVKQQFVPPGWGAVGRATTPDQCGDDTPGTHRACHTAPWLVPEAAFSQTPTLPNSAMADDSWPAITYSLTQSMFTLIPCLSTPKTFFTFCNFCISYQKVLSYTVLSRETGGRHHSCPGLWHVEWAALSFPPPRPDMPIQQQNKELTTTSIGPAHRWCHSHLSLMLLSVVQHLSFSLQRYICISPWTNLLRLSVNYSNLSLFTEEKVKLPFVATKLRYIINWGPCSPSRRHYPSEGAVCGLWGLILWLIFVMGCWRNEECCLVSGASYLSDYH